MVLNKKYGLGLIGYIFAVGQTLGGPGEGIQLGQVNLSPYVSGSYSHDSNPALDASDEREDEITELHGGIHLSGSGEQFSWESDFWGTDKRFDKLDEFDNTDFGEMVNLIMNSKGGTTLKIDQQAYEVEDIDRVSSSIEKVKVFRISSELSRHITEKTHLSGFYRYTDKDYDDPDRFSFSSHEFDLQADYDLSEKTAIYASSKFSELEGISNNDKGEVLDGIIGFLVNVTDKIDAKAGVGLMELNSDDSDEQEATFEAKIQYAVTDKVELNLNGYREIEPSSISSENYVTISKAEVEIIYTMFTSLRLTLAGTYREFDLNNPFELGEELVNKTEDLYSLIARLDYQTPADALELFLIGEVNDQDSTIDSIDYSQYSISAGISIQY